MALAKLSSEQTPGLQGVYSYEGVKRAIDVVGALLILAFALPVLCVCAAAIWLFDRGPVIYRRRVLGVQGIEFDAFKLRTMRVDADEWLIRHPDLHEAYVANVKLESDPRVTPVGGLLRRLSLD